MKICIIENIYSPYDRGGAELVVKKTAEGLVSAGHEVVIITSSPKGDEYEEKTNLKIYRSRPLNLFFYTDAHKHNFLSRAVWHVFDIFHLPVAHWVGGILREEKPDVVHTHNLMGLSFLIPRVIRKLGIKHVHTVHDVQLVEPSGMIMKQKENSWRYNGLPTKVYSFVMRKLMGSPDIVISPSEFLRGFYQKRKFFPDSNVVILRNPVKFLEGQEDNKKRVGGEIFKFLYIGQIENHKGINFLINAFDKFSKENKVKAELHIAGSGSLLEKIKKFTSGNDKIKVYGKVAREELLELFSNMDMTVVPSLCYENSPTVIFESFSVGLPVLASRVEGVSELIDEGGNGLTFETGNEKALIEKMRWSMDHREELKKIGNKASELIKGLSQTDYIDKLLELY